MPKHFTLRAFDLDIMLHDEALNPLIAPTRRMLANAVLGVEPEDALYGADELLQAIEAVHEELPLGRDQLAQILARKGDDLQRCLYYILAGRGIVQMIDDMRWLVRMLRTRHLQLLECRKRHLRTLPYMGVYIANEPDAVVPVNDTGFTLGASWLRDPSLSLLNEDDDPS